MEVWLRCEGCRRDTESTQYLSEASEFQECSYCGSEYCSNCHEQHDQCQIDAEAVEDEEENILD